MRNRIVQFYVRLIRTATRVNGRFNLKRLLTRVAVLIKRT